MKPQSIIVSALVRGLVCAVVTQLVGWSIGAVSGGEGANIGAGLIAFFVTLVVAGVWGLLDGRRHPSAAGPLALVWVLAGLIGGLLGVLAIPVSDGALAGGFDIRVLLSDLVNVAPFLAGLIAVPGVVGSVIGSAIGGSRSSAGSAAAG